MAALNFKKKHRNNSLLDDQIPYLWAQMNTKRRKDPKFISKSCPKTVYMFEFMNSNRSWLDPHGLSNTYLKLDTYNSIKVPIFYLKFKPFL